MPDKSGDWFLYLIRCNNGHLYTGITTDVERRFSEHCSGKGAKFLRGKGPLELVYQKKVGTRSEALKEEINIKNMTKANKEEIVHKQLT